MKEKQKIKTDPKSVFAEYTKANDYKASVGELGIFVLDGNGYFKKFGGDRLISLNEDYGDILLNGYSEIVCCGKVVGKLKKRA